VADATLQIQGLGTHSVPLDYTVSGAQSFGLVAIRAQFDGAAAAGSFKPCVQLVSPAGTIMSQTISDTVAAGSAADVTFLPFRRRIGTAASGQTYAQIITALQATNTLVAEWNLDEGASPYADTSGFAPGDPSTMTRQVRVVPMTQRYTPGPFLGAQGGPAVAFNFDGDGSTSSGDFLTDAIASPSRYYFLGNLPFSVVFWVVPFPGVATHDGPIVSTIHVTGFGAPTAHDDGWRLNVTYPGLIPQLQRACDVLAAGTYDTCAGPALSTTQWSMLSGTYDGANMKLYVNGALQTTTASAGAITSTATNATIGAGIHKLGDFATWYYGAAARGSIWASTLSATDMASLYAAGTS
jgi:hypothetical protein